MNTSTITEPIVRLTDRLPSVDAIADEVGDAVGGLDVGRTATRAKRSVVRSLPFTSSSRPRTRWYAGLVTLLVLAAALGWWFRRDRVTGTSGTTTAAGRGGDATEAATERRSPTLVA